MIPKPSASTTYRIAAQAAQRLPLGVSTAAVRFGGRAGSLFAGDRRVIAERNLRRAHDGDLTDDELNRSVARLFESYGRYYLDSFRLPAVDDETLDAGFDYCGFEHIAQPIAEGIGPILVLPHLGGWEWAAFWLARIPRIGVTAVVEPLDPPPVFEWFRSFRESLGMRVVPIGPEAGHAVFDGIKAAHAVCLLSDRLVANAAGAVVEFFGERTLLPAGPATLAFRTGAPLVPVAVFQRGDRHFAEVRPPVPAVREGRFRDDVQRVTQLLANELERFIRAAPEQWHVLQPTWPSDFRALGRPIPEALAEIT